MYYTQLLKYERWELYYEKSHKTEPKLQLGNKVSLWRLPAGTQFPYLKEVIINNG